jgi:hypothetical protein
MKMAVLRIAKVRTLNLGADCHRPELSAEFVLGLRAGVGNSQCKGKLLAKDLLLLWLVMSTFRFFMIENNSFFAFVHEKTNVTFFFSYPIQFC